MNWLVDWLEPNFLTDRAWRFQTPGGGDVHITHLRLFADGSMAGDVDPNARRWTLQDGRLHFLDALGRIATTFHGAELDGDGRAVLAGRYRDGSAHVLREVASVEELAPPSSLEWLGPGRSAGRRNLVIVRANEQSVHTGWTDDLPDADRSWDLCVSWYGDAGAFAPADRTEFIVLQNQQGKLPALYRLLHRDSSLWNYDYVAIVDDDVQMKRSSINVMFEVCREYRLELAQPSLHPFSVITQFETRQQPAFILRYVNYVEPMMTIFSHDALRACIGTFHISDTDPLAMRYGIDYAWPKLIRASPSSIAVIDKVAVVHTRGHGANCDLDVARENGWAIASQFGSRDYLRMRELGGVYAEPVRRNASFELDPAVD